MARAFYARPNVEAIIDTSRIHNDPQHGVSIGQDAYSLTTAKLLIADLTAAVATIERVTDAPVAEATYAEPAA